MHYKHRHHVLWYTLRSASVQQWMNVAVELKYLKLLKNFGSAYPTVMTDFPSHSGPYKCVKGARTCPHLRHVIVHVKLLPTIVCTYVHWQLQFMHCWVCSVLDISVPPSAAHLPGNAAGLLYTHKRVRATKSEVVHEVNHWPVRRLK